MKTHKSELELESVYSRIQKREIDLQPEFQRGEIWDTARKQRLVDTILRGWYVPAVHIVKDGEGNEEVLDGQQRLATIRDFFENRFPINGKIEPEDEFVSSLDGLKFSQLPDSASKAIRRFTLPIVTLSDFEPREPNELFFRLNQSYNLTPPEKRNALHGEARNQVRALVNELQDIGLLDPQAIGFSNGRLAYDDIVARACVTLEIGTLRQHINNTVVERFYRMDGGFHESTINGVRSAAGDLLEQIRYSLGRVKFNKGTLQTWLTYAFWAPRASDPLPAELLTEFETYRTWYKRGELDNTKPLDSFLLAVVGVYEDRASYRVTDVSSVLARDLAIHLFSAARFGTTSLGGTSSLLDEFSSSGARQVRPLMFEFLESSGWGETLTAR